MRMTSQYQIRGFHILSDAIGHFTPIDGVCQFEYKGHQISVSTAGMSKGACQNEVFVFGGEKRENELARTHTVQEAIQFIDALNPTKLECQIVEVPDFQNLTLDQSELNKKIAELVKDGWSVAGSSNYENRAIWVRAVS